jgi:hypothetical protein
MNVKIIFLFSLFACSCLKIETISLANDNLNKLSCNFLLLLLKSILNRFFINLNISLVNGNQQSSCYPPCKPGMYCHQGKCKCPVDYQLLDFIF